MKNQIKGIQKFSKILTLNLFNVGSKPKNFEMLINLPSNIDKLSIKLGGLSKMPLNRRINQLEKVGLIKRKRMKGLVEITDLGKVYIKLIEKINRDVEKNLFNILNENIKL